MVVGTYFGKLPVIHVNAPILALRGMCSIVILEIVTRCLALSSMYQILHRLEVLKAMLVTVVGS